jgi:hypothetical protein
MDKNVVLQEIKKVVENNGCYRFINNGEPYQPREDGWALYLAVQPNNEDMKQLDFCISWNYRFSVTFNAQDNPKHFNNLNQMLTAFEKWLQNNQEN